MARAPKRRNRRASAPPQTVSGEMRNAGLTIRVDFGAFGYLGPGKIALMELISKHGSITAAGKEMGMSYRRAWLLVDEINHIFREPLVEKQMGGSGGGGARLTRSAATWSAAIAPSRARQPSPPPPTCARSRPRCRAGPAVSARQCACLEPAIELGLHADRLRLRVVAARTGRGSARSGCAGRARRS